MKMSGRPDCSISKSPIPCAFSSRHVPPGLDGLIVIISSHHLGAEVRHHPEGGGEDEEVDQQGGQCEPIVDGCFCFTYYQYQPDPIGPSTEEAE